MNKSFNKYFLRYCFCEIPQDKLFQLAMQKFVKGLSTQELMQKARSEEEKGYIATLALMDLGEKELEEFIRRGQKDLAHVFACRDRLVSVLKDQGIDCSRGICKTDNAGKA